MKGTFRAIKDFVGFCCKSFLKTGFTLALLGLLSSQALAFEKKGNIALDLPSTTVDGSFVIRVKFKDSVALRPETRIELWRSEDNGAFSLVTSQPSFTEIAQNVHSGGQYAYQARIVSNNSIIAVSETKTIDVQLRYPQLATSFSE